LPSQTVATWRIDLVAGRRRLRVVVLIGTFAFIAADAGVNLSSIAAASPGTASANFGRALGLVALALVAGWSFLRAARSGSASTAAFSCLVAPPAAQRAAVDAGLPTASSA
jgi:hypothetical protein